MDITKYSYLWESEKDEWVLVDSEYGYSIVNKKNRGMLLISNDELEEAVINKMKEAGNKEYSSILEAFGVNESC